MRLQTAFAALILAATAAGPAAASDPAASVRRIIEKVNDSWIEAMKHADAGPIGASFDPEGVNVAKDGSCQKGPQEIARSFQEYLDRTGPAVSGSVRIGGVHIDGNLAYEWGHSDFRFAPKPGGPTARTGRYLTAWRRQADESWKILRNIGLPE